MYADVYEVIGNLVVRSAIAMCGRKASRQGRRGIPRTPASCSIKFINRVPASVLVGRPSSEPLLWAVQRGRVCPSADLTLWPPCDVSLQRIALRVSGEASQGNLRR